MYNLYRVFAVFGIILFIIVLAVLIFLLITNWRIFSKAGKPGWAALVPFYNAYIMSDIAFGNANYFIAIMFLWVMVFIGRITEIGILRSLVSSLSLVLYIIYYILYIIYCTKISKAFGKSSGFTVGLVLLPLIFFPILGFGSAEYIGPQKIKN
ncbi:hypothetical protein DS742_17780 [Lacrimispora amygdalina]|uniref:DUF805 domain-containing protein n=1 Tax=Lacrimispora amygdalina TaxID=253257 RepID=A0A3E2N975_9FIRM|nr:DUF5684 domain-containing protein [Clostridium indicum]RFZ77565.1 hypothetical protein DS742_17780 [Clostridium indicum]